MATAVAMEGDDVGDDSHSMHIDVGDNSRDFDSGKSNGNDDATGRTDSDMDTSGDIQDIKRLSPVSLNLDGTTNTDRKDSFNNHNDHDICSVGSPRHHASPRSHVNGSTRHHSNVGSPTNDDNTRSSYQGSHGSRNCIGSPRAFLVTGSPGQHGHTRSPGLNTNTRSPGLNGSAGSPGLNGSAGSPGLNGTAGSPGLNGSAGSPRLNGNAGSPGRLSNTRSPEHNGNTESPDTGSPECHCTIGSPRHHGNTSSPRRHSSAENPNPRGNPESPGLHSTRGSPGHHGNERSPGYHYVSTGSSGSYGAMARSDLSDSRGSPKDIVRIGSPGRLRNTRSPDHYTDTSITVYNGNTGQTSNRDNIESCGSRESTDSLGRCSHIDSPANPKTGSPGYLSNADQHSEDSTSCSPREERVGATSPQLPVVVPPARVTNFSIAEILKPGFGTRKCDVRLCPPVLPGNRNLSAQKNFSLELREKQRFGLSRDSRSDYGGRGVRQPPNLGIPRQFLSGKSEGRDHRHFPRELSGGPLDMTLGPEALGRNRKSLPESRVVPPGTLRSERESQPRPSSSSLSSPEPGTQPPESPRDGNPNKSLMWPAWVYCTRYSDRPSAGPRTRKRPKRRERPEEEEKRPRTAFSSQQLQRLRQEFEECRYLNEQRRQELARELQLTESQIKIWFQNKRAKIKKASGTKNALALSLMAQGLYNHATVPQEPSDTNT